MCVSYKGMQSMKLKDQVHISREEDRAQKSKQQPQIPLLCKVTNMFHPFGSPSSHKWSSLQRFLVHPDILVGSSRGITFSFLSACSEFTTLPDSSVRWEGAGMW